MGGLRGPEHLARPCGMYRQREMSIGIIGLGYVGLPLAVAFAEAGQHVVAVDVDDAQGGAVRAGQSYMEDIPSERLAAVLDQIDAEAYYAPLARTDAVLICVPTPLTANREPDLGPLLGASRALAEIVQQGQLIVLESTTYPGTTREQVQPLLEACGLKVGRDINLAFSPERVDPGRTDFTLRNTPKLVGGITPQCTDRAAALYETVCDNVVRVSTPEAAEMAKLLENIFRSVNIALVNELAILADRMGVDIWEVIDAAATKPYGFMRFDPGPGMGGHCLPVDPFYLTWRAREFHMSTEFIELAGKVNQQMPYYCVERIERALNDVKQAHQRVTDRDPGRQLQGRRRRHARVTCAAHHGAAGRARSGALLPRPVRAGPAGARAPELGPRDRQLRRRGRTGHRAPPGRPFEPGGVLAVVRGPARRDPQAGRRRRRPALSPAKSLLRYSSAHTPGHFRTPRLRAIIRACLTFPLRPREPRAG